MASYKLKFVEQELQILICGMSPVAAYQNLHLQAACQMPEFIVLSQMWILYASHQFLHASHQ